MRSHDCLDHAVINVKYNMDEAVPLFSKLGFSLTPRGFHSHGSMNHLMVFKSDYLELIGIPKDKNIERRDLMNASVGINGIVFKANDINDAYAQLKVAGFEDDQPKSFHRPVEIKGEHKIARFRTTTVRGDVFPGGRVYYCQHCTPELIWRPEWQNHPNGVTSIVEFVTVAQNTDSEAERFAILLNTDVQLDENGARVLNFENFRITVLTPKQYIIRYKDLASPLENCRSMFGAIVFATDALQRLNHSLNNLDDITTCHHPDRTIVRLAPYNTVLEFVGIRQT